MTEGPAISVWVLAYGCRPTLGRALDSLARQTIPRTAFEVLVLSDRAPPAGWSGTDRSRRWLQWPDEPLGAWFARAVPESRGDLVALLDDDDAFRPDKLAWSRAAFLEDPELAYLHHGVSPVRVGASPGPGPMPAIPTVPEPVRIPDREKTEEALGRMWNSGGAFNHSSVVLRRALLEEIGPDLQRLSLVTPALFFAAWASPGSLRFDRTPLTEYGVHAEGRSPWSPSRPGEFWVRTLRVAAARRRDGEATRALARRRRPGLSTGPLDATIARYRFFEMVAAPTVDRRALAGACAGLWRGTWTGPAGLRAGATALAAVQWVLPGRAGALAGVRPAPGPTR